MRIHSLELFPPSLSLSQGLPAMMTTLQCMVKPPLYHIAVLVVGMVEYVRRLFKISFKNLLYVYVHASFYICTWYIVMMLKHSLFREG